MLDDSSRRSQGALLQDDGDVLWRVWAPASEKVTLVTWPEGRRTETPMTPEGFGYFVGRQGNVEEGLRYSYVLADGGEYPDPASRWQPEGVNRPSAVWFPSRHRWGDDGWRGVPRDELAIYELHVGAFTPEGTFAAVIPRLRQLVELGVTAIELMPVAQFSGCRNWGYDGVHPFAAQNSYGGPRALQELVDAAHGAGLAVLLDVVYNHFGPEGNYVDRFGPYCTDRYRTPWGRAVNFDGPESDAVRRFVLDNAVAWTRDFHIDGLRLDAVHAIFDFSARHILEELQAAVHDEASRQDRIIHVMAESDLNDVRLVRPAELGGDGLDAVWSDDFHHSVHALLTGERDGYHADFGAPEQLAKAIGDVFVYDGRYSGFRRRRHGNRVGDIDRTRFVVAIQTHDQVGNRARGERLASLLPPEAQRLACGLLLLSPCVPLLFMGEEYGETRPFPFFCSFADPRLIEAVRRGRREEFAALAFAWGEEIPDPQAEETFRAAKLDWDWTPADRAARRRLYADLLAARRRWPSLVDRRHTIAWLASKDRAGGATAGLPSSASTTSRKNTAGQASSDTPRHAHAWLPSNNDSVLVVERGAEPAAIACANLTARRVALPPLPMAERSLLLSTEHERYGGPRNDAARLDMLLPYELLVFTPQGGRP